MRHRIKIKKIIFLIFFFGLAIFIFPAKETQAGWLDEAASSAIGSGILYINNLIMYFLGNLLATVAQWLGWFLNFQGQYFENISIVQESWKVFRDFTNMFFILILIIIAFATIFDMQQYNWRGLMARFIIAALLVNFSLAIGGFFIKISTTLSNVAISQFSDITANLAAGAGINKFITAGHVAGTTADDLAKLTLSAFISGTGMIIMTDIVLLAFFSALAFAVARVPVLWALLIVSPVAWISVILPQTKQIWSKWWNWFFCWTFFMPVYLFSLVIGIAILNNRPDIGAAATTSNFLGFGAQDIFFYVLTIIIMVGSLGASLKLACAAGTGVAKTMGGINKWAQDRFYVTAAKKGLTEKAAEVKDVGLKGRIGGALYGGERAERLREARVAEIFGKKGALSEAEAAEVKKSYDRRKSENLGKDDLNNLHNQAGKLNKYEVLALRKLRAENGWVASGANGEKEIKDTLQTAGINSKYAQEYIAAGEKNGWAEALGSRDQTERFADSLGAEFLPLKKSIMKQMAKNGEITTKTFAKKVLDIFATEDKETKEAIEKDLQKNIKNFSETRIKKDRRTALTDPTKLGDERLRKILAVEMAEGEGEISNYKEYRTAVDSFGGLSEKQSRDLRSKISKEDKVTAAEIEWREDLAATDPAKAEASYIPTAAELSTLVPKLTEAMMKLDAKALADVDDYKWRFPQFKTALQDKINRLQTARPPQPRGSLGGGRPKKDIPGAGEQFLESLRKTTGGSPDKIAIVKTLTV